MLGSAHPVIFSEYSLRYENEQWLLAFEQKTSYLRDAIYEERADLKGINLNSGTFLQATEDHITSNLTLTYNGTQLELLPLEMQYGGLRFNSTFFVKGLPERPDYLAIQAEGFDVHEHSIIVFRVAKEKEGCLNYFNRDQRLATFDFATHRYVFDQPEAAGGNHLLLYVILLLALAIVTVSLLRSKKAVKAAY